MKIFEGENFQIIIIICYELLHGQDQGIRARIKAKLSVNHKYPRILSVSGYSAQYFITPTIRLFGPFGFLNGLKDISCKLGYKMIYIYMMYIHVYILVCRTHNKNNTSPTLIQYARCLTSPPAICFTYMTGGFTYMAGGTPVRRT